MVTYKEAGVDQEAARETSDRIARLVRRTWGPRVLSSAQEGFAGLFQLDFPKGILARDYKDPILVGSAEGVGTKIEIAFRMGVSDTIGADLVALCSNNLLVHGAEPLFFLHFIALGKVDPDQIELILDGIIRGCREAGSSSLGGEVSEKPGAYLGGRFEIGGFAVGVVERSRLVRGEKAEEGDDVVGLASNGLHSNGYSLVRKVFFGNRRFRLSDRPVGLRRTLGEELLEPTRTYVRPILTILQGYRKKRVVHGLAHISGGGLPGSLRKAVPRHLDVVLENGDWPVPPIFRLIRETGRVPEEEMFRVFNMGIGFAMVVSPHFTDSILRQLADLGFPAWRIGRVVRGKNRVIIR